MGGTNGSGVFDAFVYSWNNSLLPCRMEEEGIRHEVVTRKQVCIRSSVLQLSITGGLPAIREAFNIQQGGVSLNLLFFFFLILEMSSSSVQMCHV